MDTLIEQAASLVRRDVGRSVDLLDRAEAALEGRRDLVRAARLSEVRGGIAMKRGQLGAAATAYRLARRNWLAVGLRLDAVRAALGCTRVQLLQGEYESGRDAVLRIGDQLRHEAHQDRRVAQLQADVQRQLGDAYAGAGRIADANRHYDTAANLYGALGSLEGMAEVLMMRGLAALDAGMTHNALRTLADARLAQLRCGHHDTAATVAALIAEALVTSGQVARTVAVLDCLAPDAARSPWNVGLHRLVRSEALLAIGFAAEAHAEATASEQAFTEIGAVDSSARAALAAAKASLRWGRTETAASELAVAERLFAECGSSLMLARVWLAQAELALSVGDDDAARTACNRVLARDLDDSAPSLAVQGRLIAARVAEPDEACDLLDAAADLAARAGVPELRVEVLLAGARHQRRIGQIDEAIEALRRALAEGRAWDARFDDGEATAWPALVEAADELITLLLERGDHAARVEAWQRARFAKSHPFAPGVGPAGDVRTPATDEQRAARLEQLLDHVGRNAFPVDRPAREEALPAVPWETLVSYYVTGDDILAFVVRDGQVDARVLADAAPETWRLVRSWQQECRLMAAGVGPSASSPASSPALDGLYEVLLAPVADRLADLEEDVRVVGHRHLHAVPFDALLDDGGPWSDRLAGRLPTLEPEVVDRQRPAGIATLVLAVPDDNAPLITAEAEMVFRTLPHAEILIGADATREALVRRASSADVLHLACHGVFRQENPLSSALRLGDGWLQAREIMAGPMALDGAVVVLSACGSGLSPDYLASPVGLTWACLAAGARGVVGALWTVDDAVTLELMTSFYRCLGQGRDVRSALRRARREVARRHPHPYYWASFHYVEATGEAT